MTQRAKDIAIYYNFAERCNDDMQVMGRVLKKHFKERRLNRIIMQLEVVSINDYLYCMKYATDEEIHKVVTKIANENGTLF